ncbi:MAG: F0F1 ATP synthase subunit gamma [Candidatus Tectomicrobia bacterium]|nr:F0F1 ATP synthase subunit gamma [Candidatus Tectomicrobia bacterium]
MQEIEIVKRKIDTAEDLQSVVKTMKALAAVSMRQYEQAVASLAEYNRTVDLGLQVVLRAGAMPIRLTRSVSNGRLGAIVFGSDQGLCGRFNDQAAASALSTLPGLEAEESRRCVFVIGTRVASRFEEMGQPVEETLTMPASLAGVTPRVHDLLMRIEAWCEQHRLDRVMLFHNRLLSGAAYTPHMVHLIPIDWTRLYRLVAQAWPSRSLPAFTMDQEPLLSSLLRQHLFVSLYRAFAESLASENASRLASMQAAERSIDERLEDLRGEFRYQRQHAITEELLDIVSGFEALNGA